MKRRALVVVVITAVGAFVGLILASARDLAQWTWTPLPPDSDDYMAGVQVDVRPARIGGM